MQNRRNYNRGSRINEAIKEEMAMILRDIKDPRIDFFTSIVKVDTTRDLKYCKIYYSVLGDEARKQETAEGLKAEGEKAKVANPDLRFSGVQSLDPLQGSEPVTEVPAAELSREDDLGKLVSAAFNLPPPPMPNFNA